MYEVYLKANDINRAHYINTLEELLKPIQYFVKIVKTFNNNRIGIVINDLNVELVMKTIKKAKEQCPGDEKINILIARNVKRSKWYYVDFINHQRSPRILFANIKSLVIIVTLLAWIAHKLVS